jgi:hypothetical protein
MGLIKEVKVSSSSDHHHGSLEAHYTLFVDKKENQQTTAKIGW